MLMQMEKLAIYGLPIVADLYGETSRRVDCQRGGVRGGTITSRSEGPLRMTRRNAIDFVLMRKKFCYTITQN